MLMGYHAVYDKSYREALAFAGENGFDYVQFDLNVPRFYIDTLSLKHIKEITSFSREIGVGISFHAPGDNVGLFSDYPEIRKGILKHFSCILEKANDLQARHVTFHPLMYPSFKRSDTGKNDIEDEYYDYYFNIFEVNLKTLAEHARNVKICIENFQDSFKYKRS